MQLGLRGVVSGRHVPLPYLHKALRCCSLCQVTVDSAVVLGQAIDPSYRFSGEGIFPT